MSLKIMLIITAILGLLFGIAFLFFPAQLLNLYGVKLDAISLYVPRYLGAVFIGFAVLNWFAREGAPQAETTRAIVLGNLVNGVLGLGVAVFNVIYQRGTGFIWSTLVIYALLTAGYAWFEFAGRTTRTPRVGTGVGTPIPH